ncbi:MAG: alpha/beta hydrolase [Henriciella sp.]|nr:alpha/beta hydrolase [Henriciella sp.]
MKILILILALIAVGVLIAFISTAFYTRKVHKKHPASGVSVNVDGSDVHVLTQGDGGPVILMLHGASANAREYEWTLAPLLSETHRVFMVDRPGHGHSDRPDNAETLEVQAAQAAGALKALAPGERAVIVGHSFGGAVALRMALDHPELVSGLVLLAPVSHDWGGGGEAWYNSYAASSIIGPLFSQLVPIVGPAQVKQGVKGVFSPQPAPEGYFEKSAIGLLFRPSEFRANARDVNALRFELAAQQERYTDISAPTVVFSGAGDTVISPPLHVGKLKHQVEGLRLVALSDDGHMPHHAYGVDIAETIRNMSKTS